MNELPVTPFLSAFQGSFKGLLKWRDMDGLWDILKTSPEGWYVFEPLAPPPQQPSSRTDFLVFLDETAHFLRKHHDQEYCGLIYVDSRDAPEFIKIFDPKNMGTACGSSSDVILPRWTVTRIKPDGIISATPEPSRKRGILNHVFTRLLGRADTN